MMMPRRRFSRPLGGLVLAAALGALVLTGATPAEAGKRNESRWFLQNVCMAQTTKLLGRSDWKSFDKEAKAARNRLKSNGRPRGSSARDGRFRRADHQLDHHGPKRLHQGPQLCIQWYKT